MSPRLIILAAFGALVFSGCSTGGPSTVKIVEEVEGGVNPYLWRASLDTLGFLPIKSADPVGGLIIYDWQSFTEAPEERIKATVFILDTRLRADGIKVSVFRQEKQEGNWVDAAVETDTAFQLENRILSRARNLKAGELN